MRTGVHFKSWLLCLLCSLACMHVTVAQSDTLTTRRGAEYVTIRNDMAEDRPVPADTFQIRKQLSKGLALMPDKPDSSYRLINDALRKSILLRFDYGTALGYSYLASYYSYRGDYDRALNFYKIAIPFAERGFKNANTLAMFYSGFSTIYYYKNLYDSMFFFTNKAEQLLGRSKLKNTIDVANLANIYVNTGSLWCIMGDYEKSIHYFFKSLSVLQPYRHRKELKSQMVTAYGNIGWTYLRSGDTTRSFYYYKKAFDIDSGNMMARAGYGLLMVRRGYFPEALTILQGVGLKEYKEHNFYSLAVARVALGRVYYELGQYGKSEAVLKHVLQQVEGRASLESSLCYDAYDLLASIYQKEGQYKLAFEYQDKAKVFLKGQLQREKVAGVYQREIKIQAASKDEKIAQEKLRFSEQNRRFRERNLWMGAIASSSFLLAVVLVLLYISSRHKQKLQGERINALRREQEIDSLKAMVKGEEQERLRLAGELHDSIMVQLSTVKMGLKSVPESFYNMSCDDYIQTPYYRNMVQMMEDVTVELRRTAHNLMPDMLLEGGITDAVFYFCNAMQYTGLRVTYQQYGTIPRQPSEFELSVFRIIQELLQNVVKHAAASRVMVQLAEVEGHILSVTVDDNGKGFDPKRLPDTKGIGLQSVLSRVQVLKGTIDIRSSAEDGTSVHMEFEMPVDTVAAKQEQKNMEETRV